MSAKMMTATAMAILCAGLAAPAMASDDPVSRVSARAGAPYSAATKVDGVLYISGQIGAGADGKLPSDFATQAHNAMDHVKSIVEGQGLTMDNIFKCTVMLADIQNFAAFNPIYTSYFTPGRLPARSAFGAAGLALGSAVEVECMAKLK